MTPRDLAAAAVRETRELHEAFEAWFRPGAADAVLARIEAALAPGFVVVSPDGSQLARHELLALLRAARGCRGPGFRIAVEAAAPLHVAPPLVLLGYVERQRTESGETTRRSSALFRADPAGPNGLRWLAVHETWIAAPGAVDNA